MLFAVIFAPLIVGATLNVVVEFIVKVSEEASPIVVLPCVITAPGTVIPELNVCNAVHVFAVPS